VRRGKTGYVVAGRDGRIPTYRTVGYTGALGDHPPAILSRAEPLPRVVSIAVGKHRGVGAELLEPHGPQDLAASRRSDRALVHINGP
jgi:hypothetical protein